MKQSPVVSNKQTVINLGNGRAVLGVELVNPNQKLECVQVDVRLELLKECVKKRLEECTHAIQVAAEKGTILLIDEYFIYYKEEGLIKHFSFKAQEAMNKFLTLNGESLITIEDHDPLMLQQSLKAVEDYWETDELPRRVVLDAIHEMLVIAFQNMH